MILCSLKKNFMHNSSAINQNFEKDFTNEEDLSNYVQLHGKLGLKKLLKWNCSIK